MKGKIVFVVGLATGYVLGTRAGRERYEQIKSGWLTVWNTQPVQDQVAKVEGFAKARISEVPQALFAGVKKVVNTIGSDQTPGQKLDATIATAKAAVDEVIDDVAEEKPAAKKPGAKSASSTRKTTGK